MEEIKSIFRLPFYGHRKFGGKTVKVIAESPKTTKLALVSDTKTTFRISNQILQQCLNPRKITLHQDRRWIQQFRKIKQLGKGAYGSVYTVCRISDSKKFALKEIIKTTTNTTNTTRGPWSAEILEECCAFLDLVHPNLVTPLEIHADYFNNELKLFFLMELMDTSLRGLQKKQRLSINDTEKIVIGILKGLTFMHSMGYTHSDLTPNNVLVNVEHGEITQVALTDFSLTRKITGRVLPTRIVTIWYRAPELFSGHKSFTEQIDIWATGIIAIECLIGRAIFRSSDRDHVIRTILGITGPPRPEWTRIYGNLVITKNQEDRIWDRLTDQLRAQKITGKKEFYYRLLQVIKKAGVNIKLTPEYDQLVEFIRQSLAIDQKDRILAQDACDKLEEKSDMSINCDIKHFDSHIYPDKIPLDELKTTLFDDHFGSVIQILLADSFSHVSHQLPDFSKLALRLFSVQGKSDHSECLNLFMIGASSLAIKHLVYKILGVSFSPSFDNILSIFPNLSMKSLIESESFILNNGGFEVLRTFR